MSNPLTQDIKDFNTMYGLPCNSVPCIPFKGSQELGSVRQQLVARLVQFRAILAEELDEVEEIMNKIDAGDEPVEILTALADWLGDIQIYCASEMRKFGLDNDIVLSTIMLSNFSKLGLDGKPIYDERGKVQKGPGYWKPEPKLKRMIQAAWVAEAASTEDADDQS